MDRFELPTPDRNEFQQIEASQQKRSTTRLRKTQRWNISWLISFLGARLRCNDKLLWIQQISSIWLIRVLGA